MYTFAESLRHADEFTKFSYIDLVAEIYLAQESPESPLTGWTRRCPADCVKIPSNRYINIPWPYATQLIYSLLEDV